MLKPALEAFRRIDQAFYARSLRDRLIDEIGGCREQFRPPATEQDGSQEDLLIDIVVHAAPSMLEGYELVARAKTNLLGLGDLKIEYIRRFLNSILGSRWSKAYRAIGAETFTLMASKSPSVWQTAAQISTEVYMYMYM